MKIVKTPIEGLLIIEPKVWKDHRGYFYESYSQRAMKEAGIDIDFVQDNESKSSKGVLRGLHYQSGDKAQTKLVRVTCGEVLDVAVDLRPDSPTYGKHLTVLLNEFNKKQMLVPRGFAHGYIVLSDVAVFQYKCDNFYCNNTEGGICYNDPELSIDWILDESQYSISEKDLRLPMLGNHKSV